MRAAASYPGRLSPKVLNVIFWLPFLGIAGAAFYLAPRLGYVYASDVTLATYSTVVQGVGALLAIVATGLLLTKLKIDSAVSSLEERTLGVLNNRFGWSVIRWSDDLEEHLEEQLVGSAYPEVGEGETSTDYLEQELDDLLDAILAKDTSGGQQVQQEVLYQEAKATLSTDVKEVLGALRERRSLMTRRHYIVRFMTGPLAMLAALVAISAWALPAISFLQAQASLNTALLFTATYGGAVALFFTVAAALKAAFS